MTSVNVFSLTMHYFTLIKVHYSQFFVQNFVFLMNPICIQVVIKHEHMKIESNSLFFV